MKFSTTLIALVAAGLANAQLPDIPECALNCFVEALTTDGCSALTDFECHCKKPELPGKITPCVEKACEPADQSAVSDLVEEQCSAAGAPIDLPPIGGGDDKPTTSAAAPPTTTTTGGATPAPTDDPTDSPTTSNTVIEPTSGVATPTGGYPSGTPTPSEFPGAGSNLNANIGGVAAALLAVAAYL
ncbi:hypothetical protein FQN55_001629 [Onygenales sp. PD_40]|nr:hypothetical protein FQN55_001629 [Onygenales sp. PD_40]KAK2794411.1 hypothetical protein FQN51_000854 [Onygenales sp. PD_10]